MDEFLILLQSKLDEAKSKSNINADIDKIQSQLDKLKIQAEIDPKTISNLTKQLEGILNQKIVISEIGINSNNIIKAAQQTGRKIGNAINQGVTSTASKTNKVLKSFTELKIGTGNIDAILDKDGLLDIEQSLNKVKQIYSEFGQVKITNKIFDLDGNLQQFRVDIQQVNGELKESRNFMMALSSDGKSFGFPQDIIKGSESFVHHLNEAKNISNATGEELNAQKEKLAEQEKYYSRLEQASKEQLAIEKQRITAGEKQLEILDAQSKRRDSRISYNEKQIDKKGLSDTSKQRKINDLSYSGNEKIGAFFAKEIDKNLSSLSKLKIEWQKQGVYVDEFKTKVDTLEKSLNKISIGDIKGLNTFKEQISSLSNEAKQLLEINKIQLLMDTGETESKIETLISKTNQWTDTNGTARISTQSLTNALDKLEIASNEYLKTPTEEKQKALIEANEQLSIEYKKVASEVRSMNAEFAKDSAIDSLRQQYQTFYSENSKAHKQFGSQLKSAMEELAHGAEVPKERLNVLKRELVDTKNVCKELGLTGQTWFQNLGEKIKQLSTYLSGAVIIGKITSTVGDEISELKELDSILTEIGKTSDLTNQELKRLGSTSFESASLYGKNASDYLTGVQEMYRAGFKNAENMAKLSLLAQSAGDMAPNSANDYLMATNAAYDYKGSVEKLNEVLDSQNYITNNAAVSMQDMADATSEAASISAQYGVGIEELSSLIAVAVSKTRESGSEVGNALKSIFITLQDTTSKPVVEAFDAVGISMTKIVDGSERLKTPIELLKELSVAFNKLPEGDTKRANILTDIGKKYHANTLSAILSDWESYESMLDLYSQGMGSAAKEAEKSANNIEGSFNRLKNTWIDTVENVINSDAILAVTKALNGMLSVVNNITDKLGSLGTIGTISGAIAGTKGLG